MGKYTFEELRDLVGLRARIEAERAYTESVQCLEVQGLPVTPETLYPFLERARRQHIEYQEYM